MEIDLFMNILGHHFLTVFWCGEATVIESFAILGPRCAGKFGPFEVIGEVFPGRDFPNLPLNPIRTRGRGRISEIFTIRRNLVGIEGDCAILGELIRI